MRSRFALLLAATTLAVGATGCGDGEDLLEEPSLRDCLAGEELELEPVNVSGGVVLGSISPDFRLVTPAGEGVDVVVQGTEQKASRTAADIRGSLQAFGAADSVVIVNRNAIVVFEGKPSADLRRRVEDCLDA